MPDFILALSSRIFFSFVIGLVIALIITQVSTFSCKVYISILAMHVLWVFSLSMFFLVIYSKHQHILCFCSSHVTEYCIIFQGVVK